MKNPQRQLRTDLTEQLQTRLNGLNQKHAKKLHKTVVSSVDKLARKFAKLLGKELKAREKKHLLATKASVKELVQQLHVALGGQYGGAGRQRLPMRPLLATALA